MGDQQWGRHEVDLWSTCQDGSPHVLRLYCRVVQTAVGSCSTKRVCLTCVFGIGVEMVHLAGNEKWGRKSSRKRHLPTGRRKAATAWQGHPAEKQGPAGHALKALRWGFQVGHLRPLRLNVPIYKMSLTVPMCNVLADIRHSTWV